MPLTITNGGSLSDDALPVDDLAAQMRLPAGWDADAARRDRMRHLVHAAINDVEARTGRLTLRRTVSLAGTAPGGHSVALPVAPVDLVVEASVRGTALAPEAVRVTVGPDGMALTFDRALVAGTPVAASVRAGHGAWADVPAALREAILILAESLDTGDLRRSTETGLVRALLAPFRPRRLRGAS